MNLPTFKGSLRLLRNLARPDKDRFLWQVPGVIHVGANAGFERLEYVDKLLSVVWVDAHPAAFADLQKNIEMFPEQRALQALVGARDGEKHVFYLSEGSGAASSMLPLHDVNVIWPDVRYEAAIELTGVTLPTLLENNRISASDYPALVLDTQGSELMILKGAEPILGAFRYVKTEVADFEAYEGCALLPEIDDFMKSNGFRQVAKQLFASDGGSRNYYDVIYRRRDFQPFFPCRFPLRRPFRGLRA